MSALRIGLQPWCADLFADTDLQRIATVAQLPMRDYPRGFVALAEHAPPGPWMYTGGLENHPSILRSIRRHRVLWGIDGKALRALRSPATWTQCLRDADIACPRIAATPDFSRRAIWLRKPKHSAAGHNITRCTSTSQPPSKRGYFFQEYIPGDAHSAVFVADGATSHLLGVTKQLVGEAWCHALPFAYCGSIGPVGLSGMVKRRLQWIGQALTSEFAARGLFGIDFILQDKTPWPVEINPRYTASVEVLEYALKTSFLLLHREVFESPSLNARRVPRSKDDLIVGKAILFAQRNLTMPKDGPRCASNETRAHFDMPHFADIPHASATIGEGKPIMTVFAAGESIADCERSLREKTMALDRWLHR